MQTIENAPSWLVPWYGWRHVPFVLFCLFCFSVLLITVFAGGNKTPNKHLLLLSAILLFSVLTSTASLGNIAVGPTPNRSILIADGLVDPVRQIWNATKATNPSWANTTARKVGKLGADPNLQHSVPIPNGWHIGPISIIEGNRNIYQSEVSAAVMGWLKSPRYGHEISRLPIAIGATYTTPIYGTHPDLIMVAFFKLTPKG